MLKQVWVVRMCVFFVIFTFLIFLIIDFCDFNLEKIETNEEYFVPRILLGVLGVTTVLSAFGLWGIMLYHWGSSNFTSKNYKLGWLLCMLLANVLGAIIYYFAVYEFKETLARP